MKPRKKKTVFDELWRVWQCDETLSQVFDISSELKLKLQRNKIVKFFAN